MNTIICNKSMISLLMSCRNRKTEMSVGLTKILSDGLVCRSGCLLLKNLYEANKRHVRKEHFEDLTGYETFVNGFVVNDFCGDNYLRNSLLFINAVSELVNKSYSHIPTEIVLSKSDRSYHFTMHTLRVAETPYLANDLESYTEPTMVVRLIAN